MCKKGVDLRDNITLLREELTKIVVTRRWLLRVFILVNVYVLIVSLTVGWELPIQGLILALITFLDIGFWYMIWKFHVIQKDLEESLMNLTSELFQKSFEQKEK